MACVSSCRRPVYVSVLLALLFAGCSSMSSEQRSRIEASAHFNKAEDRFENTDGTANEKSFGALAGLAGDYFNRPDDPNEATGFPLLAPNSQPDSARQAVWIGHSTVLVSIDGVNVLTDPVFSDRASPVSFAGPKRVVPPALTLPDLPEIDAVVISHSHYDHLDLPSLTALHTQQPQITFLVPLGLKDLLQGAGITKVLELDWWEEVMVDKVKFTATPVRHWSSRTPFDRNQTLWSGWMVNFPDYAFYFAGDTGYTDDFIQTRERLGAPDLAAIPIGAYDPREFMKASHMNPEEAVRAFEDLQADKAIAVHWGTFKLTLEPLAEPPQRLKAELARRELKANRFQALSHGQKLPL